MSQLRNSFLVIGVKMLLKEILTNIVAYTASLTLLHATFLYSNPSASFFLLFPPHKAQKIPSKQKKFKTQQTHIHDQGYALNRHYDLSSLL